MMILGMLLTAQAAVAPAPETVAMGERLARTGVLATLLPLQAAKDTDEMVAAHPELNAAEQGELRRTAAATADALAARLFATEGRAYAELLTPAELTTLVAQAESPAAQRRRAIEPKVIVATMGALAGVDFKGQTLAAFCTATGRACQKK